MSHRSLLVAAVACALSAPAGGALAADLAVGPPAYAPSGCVAIDHAPVATNKHKHGHGSDYVRIYDVAPYDPRCPQGQPAGIYVPPQTAYLVSSPTRFTKCVWPCKSIRSTTTGMTAACGTTMPARPTGRTSS